MVDKIKSCKQGEIVFREGDAGDYMYRILDGGAAVYANYGTPDEALLTKLRVGDYFGEMAVIEISPRSATVISTAEDTRLKVIDANGLGDYLKRNKGEIHAVARHLSSRLRALTADYVEVCDTLRELGRLDTSGDKISVGLLDRVKKFAAVYWKRGKAKDAPAAHIGVTETDNGYTLPLETYRKGEPVFREKDHADCLYDIRSGRVGIFTGYGTASQKLLAELTEDMFFGEMGLFEHLQRSATAVALEDDTRLEPIREADLASLFEKNPAKALRMLQHLSSRLRKLTRDYLSACQSLAEVEKEFDGSGSVLTPEAKQRMEYINQLMLMPEALF